VPFLNPNADHKALGDKLSPESRLRIRRRLEDLMKAMPPTVATVDEVLLYNQLRLNGVPGVDPKELARLTVRDTVDLLVEAGFVREGL